MTLTDTGVVLFPSLTFCKKYIFDQNSGVLDQLQAGVVGAGEAIVLQKVPSEGS